MTIAKQVENQRLQNKWKITIAKQVENQP